MRRIVERINRHVPEWFRKNTLSAGFLAFIYRIIIPVDPDFKEQIINAVHMYKDSNIPIRKLYHDMIREFVKSWVRPVEYAKFEFFDKSRKERDTYIPDYEEIAIFKRKKGNNILPDSKYERYQMFQKHFHREVLCISDQTSISNRDYEQFISGKDAIVVKPLKGTKGHGVEIVATEKIPSIKEFVRQYTGNCLLEENIKQGKELKQFHPNSVNTVRFVTGINYSGEFNYIFALIRIGQGGSVIDNVSSGGLVALIDLEKGEICTSACRGTSRYESHPDTNVTFKGFKIPQWNELCLMVKKMHQENSGQRVFGFDLAWTENGWDLVEVNPAPSLTSYQELTGRGIRPYLQSISMI